MLAFECLRLVLVGSCAVVAGAQPKIPILTYLGPDQQYRFTSMPVGEIGFQFDGWEQPRTAPDDQIPDSFQHRVSCDSQEPPQAWIQDYFMNKAVAYTNCKNLVAQSTISLKTNILDSKPRSIPFRPIPVSQDWEGYKVTSTPGEGMYQLSTCCDRDQCPTICLANPKAQRCYLEVFTTGPEYDIDYSAGSLIAQGFTGKFNRKVSGGKLYPRFRIPCEYCPLTNCITNCTNGQYATKYSDYQVGLVLLGSVLVGPDRAHHEQGGIQASKIQCKTCEPGTWNTCVDKKTCVW